MGKTAKVDELITEEKEVIYVCGHKKTVKLSGPRGRVEYSFFKMTRDLCSKCLIDRKRELGILRKGF